MCCFTLPVINGKVLNPFGSAIIRKQILVNFFHTVLLYLKKCLCDSAEKES